MYSTESIRYDESNPPMDEPSTLADPAILLAEANEEAKKPAHRQGFLENLAAAKDRFFDNLAGIPEVTVSEDHTAQVSTEMEYTVLLDKTAGSLCTFFYRRSDPQDCKLKDEVIELARTSKGHATFAFVDSDHSKKFVQACALQDKLPAFAIADKIQHYVHLYTRATDTTSFKGLIERFERGDRRKAD